MSVSQIINRANGDYYNPLGSGGGGGGVVSGQSLSITTANNSTYVIQQDGFGNIVSRAESAVAPVVPTGEASATYATQNGYELQVRNRANPLGAGTEAVVQYVDPTNAVLSGFRMNDAGDCSLLVQDLTQPSGTSDVIQASSTLVEINPSAVAGQVIVRAGTGGVSIQDLAVNTYASFAPAGIDITAPTGNVVLESVGVGTGIIVNAETTFSVGTGGVVENIRTQEDRVVLTAQGAGSFCSMQAVDSVSMTRTTGGAIGINPGQFLIDGRVGGDIDVYVNGGQSLLLSEGTPPAQFAEMNSSLLTYTTGGTQIINGTANNLTLASADVNINATTQNIQLETATAGTQITLDAGGTAGDGVILLDATGGTGAGQIIQGVGTAGEWDVRIGNTNIIILQPGQFSIDDGVNCSLQMARTGTNTIGGGGSVVIAYPEITAGAIILLTNYSGANPLYVSAINAGNNFTVSGTAGDNFVYFIAHL